MQSYIQTVVADGVACVNTAANAANSLLKTVAADEVAAIDGWAANAKTYDLAYKTIKGVVSSRPLKSSIRTQWWTIEPRIDRGATDSSRCRLCVGGAQSGM